MKQLLSTFWLVILIFFSFSSLANGSFFEEFKMSGSAHAHLANGFDSKTFKDPDREGYVELVDDFHKIEEDFEFMVYFPEFFLKGEVSGRDSGFGVAKATLVLNIYYRSAQSTGNPIKVKPITITDAQLLLFCYGGIPFCNGEKSFSNSELTNPIVINTVQFSSEFTVDQIIGFDASLVIDASVNDIGVSTTNAFSNAVMSVVKPTLVIGDNTGIELSEAKITQAVFDTDGINDLVLNRTTAIFATIQSNVNGIATLRACVADASGQCDEILSTKDVDLSLYSQAKEVTLPFFIPNSKDKNSQVVFDEGQHKIIIEIDPSNSITPESDIKELELIVKFTETKPLSIQYILNIPKECKTNPSSTIVVDCSPNLDDVEKTVFDSNILIQDIFPIPDNGIMQATSFTNENGSSSWWLGDIWELRKLNWFGNQADRVIGLVPDGYFEYHNENKLTKGVKSLTVPNVILATIGRPDTVTHELGHTYFGTEEGYTTHSDGTVNHPGDPANGFNIRTNQVIQGLEMMGASDPLSQYWISNGHWKELISQLSVSGKDPQLLGIGAFLKKDGSLNELPWFVVDGIPQPIPSGDYAVVLKDAEGHELSKTPFAMTFKAFIEPFGEQDLEEDLIALAIPYPIATALVEIIAPDGSIMIEVDPTIKILNDAINEIPESCFLDDPTQQRQDLLNYIERVDQLIQSYDRLGASYVIKYEIIPAINIGLANDCIHLIPNKTVKQSLLETIDSTILHIDGRLAFADQDGDGVLNDQDICPNSDLSETVVIGSCDSNVTNIVMENGCTISDEILSCVSGSTNHGQFVKCVSNVTNRLKKEGIITGKEKGKIKKCAAKSNNSDDDSGSGHKRKHHGSDDDSGSGHKRKHHGSDDDSGSGHKRKHHGSDDDSGSGHKKKHHGSDDD